MINQEAIKEFKELYFQEYGVVLTDEQALDYGIRLVRLVKAVYGDSLPKANLTNMEPKSYAGTVNL